MFRVIPCVQFYRLMQLIFFSTSLKGIIRKECQSFTNHGHAKTPPAVFNPLSLWLTLPRDMGVSHTHNGLPALPEPFLRACGLHRVCTRLKKNKTAEPFYNAQGSMYSILSIDTTSFFLHHLRALSAKNANHLQTTGTLKRHPRYSIHYHCG